MNHGPAAKNIAICVLRRAFGSAGFGPLDLTIGPEELRTLLEDAAQAGRDELAKSLVEEPINVLMAEGQKGKHK